MSGLLASGWVCRLAQGCTPGEGQEDIGSGNREGTSTLPGRGVSVLEWRKAVAGPKAHRQARKPENKG